MNSTSCWINGRPGNRVSVQNRALQYGDGVFETIRIRNGRPEFPGRHLTRLRAGCERLRLGEVDWSMIETQLQQCAAGTGNSVVKITLVRGQGARGYAFDMNVPAESIVCRYPAADTHETRQREGVRVRVCSIRLAVQPLLAGIKHLNRLEQVLARGEWSDRQIAEGLILDSRDHVVEGTMSNLFAVCAGRLLTPELSACGVSGILRSVVLDTAGKMSIDTEIRSLKLKDLGDADELFICNSIIGIWPVVEILDQGNFSVGPVTAKLQAAIAGQGGEDNSANWYPR